MKNFKVYKIVLILCCFIFSCSDFDLLKAGGYGTGEELIVFFDDFEDINNSIKNWGADASWDIQPFGYKSINCFAYSTTNGGEQSIMIKNYLDIKHFHNLELSFWHELIDASQDIDNITLYVYRWNDLDEGVSVDEFAINTYWGDPNFGYKLEIIDLEDFFNDWSNLTVKFTIDSSNSNTVHWYIDDVEITGIFHN